MLKNRTIIYQKVLVYLSIIVGIMIFLLGLGFMTNLHRLLFDGTYDMYEYYKSVQVLNKSMFNIGIMYLIYAFMLLPFDINKTKPGVFGFLLVMIGTIVTVIKSMTMFKYIPFFQDKYNAFDFSVIEGYRPSPWIFDLSKISFLIWDIIAILLMLVVVINFVKYLKEKKPNMKLRGVQHEA